MQYVTSVVTENPGRLSIALGLFVGYFVPPKTASEFECYRRYCLDEFVFASKYAFRYSLMFFIYLFIF